jgi:hypothetical protein
VDYVNAEIPLPESPGPWVDEYRCTCGDHLADYSRSHYGVSWDDGVELLRDTNRGAGIEGQGYRSRGPVLHAMRVLKLERWYDDHRNCGTCEIVEKHPDWWAEQEDIAREQGFTGEWDWCDDDDDDDDDDDYYDADEFF